MNRDEPSSQDRGPSDSSASGSGPRLGGSVFPVSPERPLDLGRYRVIDVLGKGGMGVVYEAIDRERNQTVALKTLKRLDPYGLRRLKAEFRSVADVVHENLVLLHELVSEGDDLFFVMEYVEGKNFLEYVRGLPAKPHRKTAAAPGIATRAETKGAAQDEDDVPPSALEPDGETRLRTTLGQVARGLDALHRAGKVHRDVKPSNVRVTPRGRAVLLDFGLVMDDARGRVDLYGPTAGTPSYMAPEQVLGEHLTPSADWYALGVMLYEALVGRKPFVGAESFLLASKVYSAPTPPAELVSSVPDDLGALCMELLRARPEERPSTEDILRRLGVPREETSSSRNSIAFPSRDESSESTKSSREVHPPEDGPPSSTTSPGTDGSPPRSAPFRGHGTPDSGRSPDSSRSRVTPSQNFYAPVATALIGRESELASLEAALVRACKGDAASTVAVAISGLSGTGKSALVRTFLDGLRTSGTAIVLEGRCYERESVRYKAFDDVIDALGQYVRHLPWPDRQALVPEGMHELARIFPVLGDLTAGTQGPDAGSPQLAPDPLELQRRAFSCLKTMLGRIAKKRPLIVYVDDLQWGDKDSGRLLVGLLSPPERPPLLLVYTFRREEAAASALLRDLETRDLPIEPLTLEALSVEDAERLAAALLVPYAAVGLATAELAKDIARESEGNPFFVEQLVRHVAGGGNVAVSLADLFDARLSTLPGEARRLLELVAVAGRPISQGVATRAASLAPSDRSSIPLLRSLGLVRTRGARNEDTVESYHDRVREHVFVGLAEASRRAHHGALAGELERTGRADPKDLVVHYLAAENLEKAYDHALRAADEAARGLAFDRAAELYGIALSCGEKLSRGLALTDVRRKCADALVSAGRCAEAAPHYLTASRESSGSRALDLRRLAAEQLLVTGRYDEGVSTLVPVLEAVGLRFPKTPRRALVSMVARIVELELRGLEFRARPEHAIAPSELERLDVAWSAGKGLLSVDSIRGGYFFVRTLHLALGVGEPIRVARGLAIYGMMNVYGGDARGERKGKLTLDRALALSDMLGDPALDGTVSICRGVASMSVGHWREGLTLMERGISKLEAECTKVAWEAATALSSCFNARFWLGELAIIAASAPAWSRSADRLGDLYSWVTAELYVALSELAAGDVAAARARRRRAMARWSQQGFHFQHWLALKIEIYCDLYEGRPEVAWTRLDSAWPELESSGLLRVQLMLVDSHLLRGTVAIACADRMPGRLATAERDAKVLAGVARGYGRAASELLRAGIARSRGRRSEAVEAYANAVRGFTTAEVGIFAASARVAYGSVLTSGDAQTAQGEDLLRAEGAADPRRFAAVFAPLR
jgi:serine/threonine protein kinase/tetratricopeptide (TPR) repeat protein